MNRQNGLRIQGLRTQLQLFKNEVGAIYSTYSEKRESARADSQRFRDAEAVFSDRRAKLIVEAREQLKEKQKKLAGEVSSLVVFLQKSIMEAIVYPLNATFLQRMNLYQAMSLKPSRMELEALLELAEGHPAALRAVDELLKLSESDLVVRHTKFEDLQQDLDQLTRFSKLVPPVATIEQIPVAVEILGKISSSVLRPNEPNALGYTVPGESLWTETISHGIEAPMLNNRGEVVSSFQPWDSVRLQMAQGAFATLADNLDALEGRWVAIGTPVIEIVSRAMLEKDETFIETEPEIVSGDGEALTLAKKLGAEQAEREKSLIEELRNFLS